MSIAPKNNALLCSWWVLTRDAYRHSIHAKQENLMTYSIDTSLSPNQNSETYLGTCNNIPYNIKTNNDVYMEILAILLAYTVLNGHT